MDRLKELQEKRLALKVQVREIVGLGKHPTPEELDKSERLCNEIEELNDELADLGDHEAIAMRNGPMRPDVNEVYPHSGSRETASKPVRGTGKTYRDLFHGGNQSVQLADDGFGSFDEYLSVLGSLRYDPRLRETRTTGIEGVGSLGGFMVPEQWGEALLDDSFAASVIMPRATTYAMTTDTLKCAGFDSTDHSTGAVGGLVGTWMLEVGTATAQAPKTRLLEMKAIKLGIYVSASRELIEDGQNFESQLGQALTTSIAFYLDDAFINGQGGGQPLGIMKDPALVTVAKETGQAAGTLVFQNIVKMWARLHPSCQVSPNCVWVLHPSLIPSLTQMSLAVGTAGVPVYMPSNAALSPLTTLMGKPVYYSELMAQAGTLGDILLLDVDEYFVGMRQELIMDRNSFLGWLTDEIGFRAILRVDGMGSWKSAITPKRGTDSLSWCVTLAAR